MNIEKGSGQTEEGTSARSTDSVSEKTETSDQSKSAEPQRTIPFVTAHNDSMILPQAPSTQKINHLSERSSILKAKQERGEPNAVHQEKPLGPTISPHTSPTVPVSAAQPEDQHTASNRGRSIVGMLGDFFSSIRKLLIALAIYVALWIGLFAALYWELSNFREAGFIAYIIATGGDPYNFKDLGEKYPFIWAYISIMHVASWLIVPVLIAAVIDATYRQYEAARRREERKMQRLMQKHVRDLVSKYKEAQGNITQADLDIIVDQAYDKFEEEE